MMSPLKRDDLTDIVCQFVWQYDLKKMVVEGKESQLLKDMPTIVAMAKEILAQIEKSR